MRDIIRRCRFAPYRKGMGPTFSLTVWDTGNVDRMGKAQLGYELKMAGKVLFAGEDFYAPMFQPIDSDDTVRSLMGFLTLKPGDTDADYFDSYTDDQRAFCDEHAEPLSMVVYDRFGE